MSVKTTADLNQLKPDKSQLFKNPLHCLKRFSGHCIKCIFMIKKNAVKNKYF